MRWRQGSRSRNIEDRRGQRMRRGPAIGGGMGLVLIVVVVLLGGDPTELLTLLSGEMGTNSAPAPPSTGAADDEVGEFVAHVLGDTEVAWGAVFAGSGERYPAPTLVLYNDAVQSACGFSNAATGPFYCPGDQKVYLDLSFLRELQRLGAPGDFAFAYVIAHEVGHHVQRITGVEPEVRRLQQQVSQADANRLSVLMELQADCYAGIWANSAQRQRDLLEPGDLQEGLAAAAAVGDDRLQRAAGRTVQPESFTHGTSEQRQRWFSTGFDAGSVASCDTFAAAGMR